MEAYDDNQFELGQRPRVSWYPVMTIFNGFSTLTLTRTAVTMIAYVLRVNPPNPNAQPTAAFTSMFTFQLFDLIDDSLSLCPSDTFQSCLPALSFPFPNISPLFMCSCRVLLITCSHTWSANPFLLIKMNTYDIFSSFAFAWCCVVGGGGCCGRLQAIQYFSIVRASY
jgi:hypothetical protein